MQIHRETMEEDEQLQQFVSAMPKVELHAHLNGCIREETLFDLAQERNVTLSSTHFGHHHQQQQQQKPSHAATIKGATSTKNQTTTTTSNSYSYMYNVKPRSLKDCFEMFAEIPKCVDDQDALTRITMEALEDFASHHVVYLELRSTPKHISNLTKHDYIETVLRAMQTFEDQEEQRYQEELVAAAAAAAAKDSSSPAALLVRLPMKSRFLVSIDRSGSVKEAEENVAVAVQLFQKPHSLVVGVDIGGNPTENDFRDFLPAVKKAREAGLKVTVHCAEVPVGEDNDDQDAQLQKSFQEVSAIFEFRPDRIGHALLLPPSLRDVLTNKVKVPVESCPTSNVMTLELAKHVGGNLIHGLQQHPQLKYWLEQDYPISIGTDDPGVFNTNPTQEILLLARAWNVSQEQVKRIVVGSMDHGFCSDELKAEIKQSIEMFFSIMADANLSSS